MSLKLKLHFLYLFIYKRKEKHRDNNELSCNVYVPEIKVVVPNMGAGGRKTDQTLYLLQIVEKCSDLNLNFLLLKTTEL